MGATLHRIPLAPAHTSSQTGDLRRASSPLRPTAPGKPPSPSSSGKPFMAVTTKDPTRPLPSEDAYQAMLKGFQWFKFTYHGNEPRLAYFVLNVTDRDVPLDVDIFQAWQGRRRAAGCCSLQRWRVCLSDRSDAELPRALQVPHAHAAARPGVLRARGRQSPGVPTPHL